MCGGILAKDRGSWCGAAAAAARSRSALLTVLRAPLQ